MKDTEPLTPSLPPRSTPSSSPSSSSISPLLLPLLATFCCVLVLTQGASFLILLTRLEGIRTRLDATELHIEQRDTLLTTEVKLIKTQLRDLTGEHHHQLNTDTHRSIHPPNESRNSWQGSDASTYPRNELRVTQKRNQQGSDENWPENLKSDTSKPHKDISEGHFNPHKPITHTPFPHPITLERNQQGSDENWPENLNTDASKPHKDISETYTNPHKDISEEHFNSHRPITPPLYPHPIPPPQAPSSRVKRRASDTSYDVSDAVGDVAGEDGELSIRLQGEDTQRHSDVDRSWLQLTSYASIPVHAIQEFCSKTRESCPPGPAGIQGAQGLPGPRGGIGRPGVPGWRGDRGLPGIPGPQGPQGIPGVAGPPGRPGLLGLHGQKGSAGLNGRDGLPGEPGLDGMPGRNGLDGTPGRNGTEGVNGIPGLDGRDGVDGRPGTKGEEGVKGETGVRGFPGPRGAKGESGTPGMDGIPGINTWHVTGTPSTELLIPPSIPGSSRHKRNKQPVVVIREGENLRLRCQAAGKPAPLVVWSRRDGGVIDLGYWHDVQIAGPLLNLTLINRVHAGVYICEADNSIPPADFKVFDVQVHFKPYIKVRSWNVGTYKGSSATLECYVEAFPVALSYWQDQVGRIISNSTKYSISVHQNPDVVWKTTMQLTIKTIGASDYGYYYCVAKNELAITRGQVKVHEIDRTRYTPSVNHAEERTFGPAPPHIQSYEELCPPPEKCKECEKCERFGLSVMKYGNVSYPGRGNRTTDCMLSAVGKPVYHGQSNTIYGSWLRDTHPRDPQSEAKYFTTLPSEPHHLYEFATKNHYLHHQHTKNHTLHKPFVGNSHVVFNGSFYYQERNQPNLIRLDLVTNESKSLPVPELTTGGNGFLYQDSHDYLDLNVDDNGLWGIYSLTPSNNTVIMKIHPYTLQIEYSWNISMKHNHYGNYFITCGVLYAVDSSTERETRIRVAFDLFEERLLDVDLPFNNPFMRTTMLGYNYDIKEIFSWDNGKQLTYPIKVIDIGYRSRDEDGDDDVIRRISNYDQDYEVDPLAVHS